MKNLWDKRAKNFPRYDKNLKEDKIIFDFFNAKEVNLKDKVILDLGCGNGRYALHLAKQARLVYAFDISSEMIENVRNDAKSHKIDNIECFCGDWSDFDISRFLQPIDIVFASLTPALNSFEKFKKAINIAKEGMMYIGWGNKRESAFLEEIFKAHNAKLEIPVGAKDVEGYLKELNIELPEVKFITKNINKKKNFQDAISDAVFQLEMHNVEPNNSLIKDIITNKWLHNDMVEYVNLMEIGMMYIKI